RGRSAQQPGESCELQADAEDPQLRQGELPGRRDGDRERIELPRKRSSEREARGESGRRRLTDGHDLPVRPRGHGTDGLRERGEYERNGDEPDNAEGSTDDHR